MSKKSATVRQQSIGLKILLWSIVVGLGGCLPLLLYIQFGPSDGNPIGLGLLAIAAIILGGIGIATGLVVAIAQYATRRSNQKRDDSPSP
jgi:branched-subunit amino acid ABC-type transport system permease component